MAKPSARARASRPNEDFGTAGRALRTYQGEPACRSFCDAPDHAGETFDDDIAWELDRLRAAGLEQVIAIDLTRPELGIPVVRVVIPGLEPLYDIPGYVPGSRARRRLLECAS